jgi:hypothetical protein
MASLSNTKQIGKDDLPPESVTEYYEDRKKIIFKKLTISKNEEYILSIVKKSQLKVNAKTIDSMKGGFFQSLPSNAYDLSVMFKENIANFSLVISLYLQENRKIDAFKLFLLLCEQNKKTLNYLTGKVLEQLPKISNRNKIAKFYPTITKTLLQIISVFIKLAGKFNKSVLENYFIVQYLKIVHILSVTVVKYINPVKIDEINTQLKNERRYFYSNCLFDCSIYLFNRFQPFNISISILNHTLDLYNNQNVNYVLNENESTLLLKINYNLGLFCYVDGLNMEAVNNFNQAKDRVTDIKNFPISKTRKSRISLDEKDLMMNKLRNNNSTSNLILDFNDIVSPQPNQSRNKYNRNTIKSTTHVLNGRESIEHQNNLFLKVSNDNAENQMNKKNVRDYSTIYLGAYNILRFKNPLEIELVRDKILVEIKLYLAEIELKNKNYRESLYHLNSILNLQKKENMGEYVLYSKDNTRLIKSKTNSSKNIIDTADNKTREKTRYMNDLKKNKSENNNSLFLITRDKSTNNTLKDNASSNNLNNVNCSHQVMKYNLTNGDKSRIMRLLEEIEIACWEKDANKLKNKNQYAEVTKYPYDRSKNYLIRNQKIITSKEMEKFFIFICSLSIYQLKILNDTQPPPSQRRNDLPIIFNNQFQDCLTNAQRMNLTLLETMSLSRYILLKDTNKDISLENLDIRFMLYRIKDEEVDNKIDYNKIMRRNRIKSNNRFKRINNSKGNSFRSNTFSIKTPIKKVKKYEDEEEDDALKYFMKNNSPKNKKLIGNHKKELTKFIEDINNDELKIFYKNPELLSKLVENTEKKIK